MQKSVSGAIALTLLFLTGCQPQIGGNSARVNSDANSVPAKNVNANSNTSVAVPSASILETKEPDQYQAVVNLTLEATSGDKGPAELPAISASVARRDGDRRMEFNLPPNEKIVYLEKSGTTYVILPGRKQYAVLDKESVGFDVRKLLMPEEIVKRVSAVKGVERIGEETVDGRTVIKYRYGATTQTRTTAGQVSTDSFFLVDKETGLPLRSETVSESSNGDVQGLKGLRIVTVMRDVKSDAPLEMFAVPADFAKIDAAQVKAQTEAIFKLVAVILNNALKSANSNSAPANDSNANTGK